MQRDFNPQELINRITTLERKLAKQASSASQQTQAVQALQENTPRSVRSVVLNYLAAGDGIDISETADRLQISADDEFLRGFIEEFIEAGEGITIDFDEAENKLIISAEAQMGTNAGCCEPVVTDTGDDIQLVFTETDIVVSYAT